MFSPLLVGNSGGGEVAARSLAVVGNAENSPVPKAVCLIGNADNGLSPAPPVLCSNADSKKFLDGCNDS